MLGRIAKGVKEGALAIALKHYVNDKLGDYGEVLDVDLDTGANKITARALLKGDRDPVTASVTRYEISRDGEDCYATLKSFSSSRAWLTLLLTKLFTDKRYKLPRRVANML